MKAIARAVPSGRSLGALGFFILVAGASGMALSFVFLASSSHLDVMAGGAGFIAGAILVAAGLVTVALQHQLPVADRATIASHVSPGLSPSLVQRWLAHFERNRANRPEPDWNAAVTLSADVVRPLVHSLEQFQLGDGGGPACLIAWDAERFRSSSPGTRKLVDHWFAEEREHARLLGRVVARFGGRCIQSHWSFTAFCMTRKWLGVRFELTVLLLTEIVSTAYYRMLLRHGQDPALRALCRLILRDEAGHVAFHRDRLAQKARLGHARHGTLWELCFRTLAFAAASMLWVNHAPGLWALGGRTREFYQEVGLELTRFIRRLRRASIVEERSMLEIAPYPATGAGIGS
jgi:hypothetical protein